LQGSVAAVGGVGEAAGTTDPAALAETAGDWFDADGEPVTGPTPHAETRSAARTVSRRMVGQYSRLQPMIRLKDQMAGELSPDKLVYWDVVGRDTSGGESVVLHRTFLFETMS
jgi:hypothetical protein